MVRSVNELVTLNLDLERFAADVVAALDEKTFLESFDPALRSITVLDPTCGSGAFLLAAPARPGTALARRRLFAERRGGIS